MTWIFALTIAVCTTAAVAIFHSRSSQLAHIARMSGCSFDKHKNSVTTQLTAGRLEFFTQYFHQYQNVLTYSDNVAFIRIADDALYTDDKPKTKPLRITIFTAEMKKRQFPPLKAAPLNSPLARSQYALMKTNIPSIDARYRLHAPSPASGILLTPSITHLFKTQDGIYLELNENALVYHEHSLVEVQDIEKFRFRAMQILGELETLIEKLYKENPTSTDEDSSEDVSVEERASSLLSRFGAPAPQSTAGTGAHHGIWFMVLLGIFFAISFLSWFVIHRWIG